MKEPFSFYTALRRMAAGERVTKLEWIDPEYWAQLLEGQLVLHKPDGVFYPWIISEGDLSGQDWMVIHD